MARRVGWTNTCLYRNGEAGPLCKLCDARKHMERRSWFGTDTLFFSEAKRNTNGVLPTETQIKTFYARLTKNKRAVAAPM